MGDQNARWSNCEMARSIQMLASVWKPRMEERREITVCLNSRLCARVNLDFTLDGRTSSRVD